MPNLYKTVYGKSLGGPDIGQVVYLVDTDYRTAVQGWSQADHTGPLDLWAEKNPGRVFYSAGGGAGTAVGNQYATDALAFTAAMDAMVDFRGDTLFLCPGAYSIATAVTWDVPYGAIKGREYSSNARKYGCSPRVRNTSVTLGVASALTLGGSADGLEVGYIRFVPLTAATGILVNATAPQLHFHDFWWDTTGITTSASTVFLQAATTANAIDFSVFDHFTWDTDAPQGPAFDLDVATVGLEISHFLHRHMGTGGTLAVSLLDIAATASEGNVIHTGRGILGTVGAGQVDLLVNAGNMTGTGGLSISEFYGDVGYCTATTLVTGTANETMLSRNFISTVEGGTGETLYTS